MSYQFPCALLSKVVNVDIPALNQDQNAVVAVDITGLGFVKDAAIIANPFGNGLHTAVGIVEVFVESATVVRIKFSNNSAGAVGPFNATPIKFTQLAG